MLIKFFFVYFNKTRNNTKTSLQIVHTVYSMFNHNENKNKRRSQRKNKKIMHIAFVISPEQNVSMSSSMNTFCFVKRFLRIEFRLTHI